MLLTFLQIVGAITVFIIFIKPILDAFIFGILDTVFDIIVVDNPLEDKWCLMKFCIKNPWRQAWNWLFTNKYSYGTSFECDGWEFDCPYRIRKIKK